MSCEPQTVAERSRLNRKRLSQSSAYTTSKDAQQFPFGVVAQDESPPRAEEEVFGATLAPQGRDNYVSPLSMTLSTPIKERQYNAVSSSMEFAKTVIGDEEMNDVGGDASVDGETDFGANRPNTFTLMTMASISQEVIDLGVQAYFDRFDWFVLLLHEPIFVARASFIFSRTTWTLDELCDVVLVLIVAALGLQCVSSDASWHGHRVLQSRSVNASGVVRSLLKEVGVHFYDVTMLSRIEAYQIVILLNIYHVYFGTLDFARHMSSVPARMAHQLGLHHDKVQSMDYVTYQVGIRCWNHAVVGDLFASMIYGQPSSLDPAFSRFRTLSELGEIALPKLTAALPIITNSKRTLSKLTFHVLKFEIYEVIQGTMQDCKGLNLQNAISVQDLTTLTKAVDLAEARLEKWSKNLPAAFDPVYWADPEPWVALQADDMYCTIEDRSCRRKMALQGIVLQVLYDSAIIFAHRPLLQCRMIVSDNELSNIRLQHIPDSLTISAEAALRISRRPISHFKHQLALSFIFMHLFTAGVILCVPPIYLPYGRLASASKAGVLRIISISRAMSSTNSIARHTDQVLTNLYLKTIQREMDGALRKSSQENVQWEPHTRMDSVLGSQSVQLGGLATPQRHLVEPVTSSTSPEVEDSAAPFVNNGSTSKSQGETFQECFDKGLDSSTYPMVSYLQFSSSLQDDTDSTFLNEHLDEAFGAFNQSKPLLPIAAEHKSMHGWY